MQMREAWCRVASRGGLFLLVQKEKGVKLAAAAGRGRGRGRVVIGLFGIVAMDNCLSYVFRGGQRAE